MIDDLLREAVRLHRAGRVEDAGELYGRVLHHAPDHPGVLHMMGLVHRHRGDVKAALAFIRRAIARDADLPGARENFLGTLTSALAACDVGRQGGLLRTALGMPDEEPEGAA